MAEGVEKLQKAIQSGTVYDKIAACKRKFDEIGGTVFVITALKR
jgi:hypothetical protein